MKNKGDQLPERTRMEAFVESAENGSLSFISPDEFEDQQEFISNAVISHARKMFPPIDKNPK